MQVTREDLNPCTVLLNVVCSAEQVADAFDRALKAIAKDVRVPGFRPGHAPKQMVEKMVDEREIYGKASEILIDRTFKVAMEMEKVQPDTGVRPSVELTDLDRAAKTGAYSAKVPLPPKIKLSEYKGLPASHPATEVTAEEVEFQINELRKKQGSREAITDRTAQDGDYGVVNIKLDGEAGEGKNFMVVLGQTFPTLDKALMGMSAEEMKHLELDFPGTFSEKAWAGKNVKRDPRASDRDEFLKSLLSHTPKECCDMPDDSNKIDYLKVKLTNSGDLKTDGLLLPALQAVSTRFVPKNVVALWTKRVWIVVVVIVMLVSSLLLNVGLLLAMLLRPRS